MRLALGAAAAVQQLVEHRQGGEGQHGEDEEQEDDEAGHVPAVVEGVDLLHLHGDTGEGHCLSVPGELAGVRRAGGVGHDSLEKRSRKDGIEGVESLSLMSAANVRMGTVQLEEINSVQATCFFSASSLPQ